MIRLPDTPALRAVARRVVWFKAPEAALADTAHFLAHVMTYGTPEDLAALAETIPRSAFRDALDHAPPGIFDPRSWAYWNLVLAGRSPPPPQPTRAALQPHA
jgi:hypothetical protein